MHQPIPLVARIDNSQSVFYHFSGPLTGEKPDVQHSHTFGCVANSHAPKDEQHKLDSKARKCTFLGYGNEVKEYRMYDMQSKRVFHSRDVLFNEQENEHEELTTENKPPEQKRCDMYQLNTTVTVANCDAKKPTTVIEALVV